MLQVRRLCVSQTSPLLFPVDLIVALLVFLENNGRILSCGDEICAGAACSPLARGHMLICLGRLRGGPGQLCHRAQWRLVR